MKIHALLFTLLLSAASANNLRGLKQNSRSNRRSGSGPPSTTCVAMPPCGCLEEGCCCVPDANVPGGHRAECAAPICARVFGAGNNRAKPCYPYGHYVVKFGGVERIVCMGPAKPVLDIDRDGDNADGDGSQPVPGTDPTEPAEPNGGDEAGDENGGDEDNVEDEGEEADDEEQGEEAGDEQQGEEAGDEQQSDDNGDGGEEESVDVGEEEGGGEDEDDDSQTAGYVRPCSVETWDLSGNGEGKKCTKNDDCKYGCCSSQDSQVKGFCINPFINKAFQSFLKCMPEYSVCELNRAGLDPPQQNNDPIVLKIEKCKPGASARSAICCQRGSDCKNIGPRCCSDHYKQCLPRGISKKGHFCLP